MRAGERFLLVSAVSFLTAACGAAPFPTAAPPYVAPAAGQPAPQPAAGDGESSALARIRLDLPWPDMNRPAPPVGGGERDAAVIAAIEKYDFVPGVPGARQNAAAWYDYFTKTLGVPVGNVKLMPQRDATREGIRAALDYAAKRAEPAGRVWFVFIGHGAPTSGDGLLLGVDVRQTVESLEARSLRRGEALAALNRSRAQPVLVIDACFSGRTGGGDAVIAGLMPVRNAEFPPPGKAIVMTAASGDQYAGPLPGAARPAFSYLALGALRGWGDANRDGGITAAETVGYAQTTMGALVNGREQTPDLAGGEPNAVLATGRESGPDISELARQLSEGEDVLFNQDGLVLGDLPTLNLQELDRGSIEGDVDLARLSIDEMKRREETYQALQAAKSKVEAARAARKGDPTGEKQQAAWCDLSTLADPNPYRAEAEKACSQATSYVEQRRRLVVAMGRDWEKVSYMMSLESYDAGDKKKVMIAFLRTYNVLSEQVQVREARRQAEKLGVTPADVNAPPRPRPRPQPQPETRPQPQPAPPPPVAENARQTGDYESLPEPQTDAAPMSSKMKAGVGLLTVGMISMVFGGISAGVAALHGGRVSDTQNYDPDTEESLSKTWAGLMWAGFGIGTGMVLVGIPLIVTARKDQGSARVALAPLFDGENAALVIHGEW